MARLRSKPLERKDSGVPRLKVAREPMGSILIKMPQSDVDRLKLHSHGRKQSAGSIVSDLVRTHLREYFLGRTGVRGGTVAVLPPVDELAQAEAQELPDCLGPVEERTA